MIVVSEGRGLTRRMVRAPLEVWWERLRQRVRVMAAWAVELRGRDMAWIVKGTGTAAAGNGAPAVQTTTAAHSPPAAARAGAPVTQPTTAPATRNHAQPDGGVEADRGQRRSQRLQGETRQYRETRERKERPKKQVRRQAVPAAISTREGIRLWWWLAGGEGSDANGPSSVRHGWRPQEQGALQQRPSAYRPGRDPPKMGDG